MRPPPRRRRPDSRPKPPSGPPTELVIEAMGGEGDGVAFGPAFVPFTLPGERVLAVGGGERRELAQVLTASAQRIAPVCPHFGTCGGCALQHWAATPSRVWKRDTVVEALAQVGLDPPVGELIDA